MFDKPQQLGRQPSIHAFPLRHCIRAHQRQSIDAGDSLPPTTRKASRRVAATPPPRSVKHGTNAVRAWCESLPRRTSPDECPDALRVFASAAVPTIDAQAYATHVASSLLHSDETLEIAVVLVRRLEAVLRVTADIWTAHRLLLAAIDVAQKAHYDDCASTTHMAAQGGLPAAELASLEGVFLRLLSYRAQVMIDDIHEGRRTTATAGQEPVAHMIGDDTTGVSLALSDDVAELQACSDDDNQHVHPAAGSTSD